MNEEKGPHCSLTQLMLERYLSDAVSLHKEYKVINPLPDCLKWCEPTSYAYPFNGESIKYAPPKYWEEVRDSMLKEKENEDNSIHREDHLVHKDSTPHIDSVHRLLT